jgi:hypothetical protein
LTTPSLKTSTISNGIWNFLGGLFYGMKGLLMMIFFSNGSSGNSYLTWSYLDLGDKLLMVAMDHALEFAKPRDIK